MNNDFKTDLAYSHSLEEAGWWEQVYRLAFHNYESMASVRQDGWAQRGGIDRIITLSSGKTLAIDEKVRRKDYGDILIEFWSSYEHKTPGWIEKDLACDYIAYAFEPSKRCYLLPFIDLQRAWRLYKDNWVKDYGTKKADNKTYTTISCPVPIKELQIAVANGLRIDWR